MKQQITLVTNQYYRKTDEEISHLAAKKLGISVHRITGCILEKKSVDARKGQLKVNLRYTVYVDEAYPPVHNNVDERVSLTSELPAWKDVHQLNGQEKTVQIVIVGSGPAGLFAALTLLELGIKPIIIERGADASARKRSIAAISRSQTVDPESNYCFGEGGAGTFSDGKLYTRSNKRGDVGSILSILHYHGADADILTEAHPHIGTDRLPDIVGRIRETIVEHGGEIHFNTRCTEFIYDTEGRVCGIAVEDGRKFTGAGVILAAGHSARDIISLLARSGAALESKPFAMGVRVEHPRSIIDAIQYHGQDPGDLGAASYRLTAQADGRGVYSFCMCPGGVIVPSATENSEIVVNGMSPASRGTRWSNAAIVVEIRPEDIPIDKLPPDHRYQDLPEAVQHACVGLRYQEMVEHQAKKAGSGQKAPAQRLTDFMIGKFSAALPACSYTPGIVSSRLDQWLPQDIVSCLRTGFTAFNQRMRGFICESALLAAVESRTSSPIRVIRDPESLECVGLPGVYPAGEGSGYAGGIASSAMDGVSSARAAAGAAVRPGLR
jgi:uncharacterized protein